MFENRIQGKNSAKTDIRKVGGLPVELKSTAVSFCFSPNSEYLAAADMNRNITIVELKADENVRLVTVLNAESAGKDYYTSSRV